MSAIQRRILAPVSWIRERTGFDEFERANNWFALLFLLPALLTLTVFVVFPVAYAFDLSLRDADLLVLEAEWVGLENYRTLLFHTPDYWASVWRGVIFTVASVSLQLIVGLGFALMLNRKFRGAALARTLAIFPYLVPTIAVALIWQWLFNESYGIVNAYALEFGLIDESISFFGSYELGMPILVIANSWKFTSFVVLILLARLQSIDQRMYEQAKISGASAWQMFRTITLPQLWSAIMLIVLLRLIWMFNRFDIIWLLTGGGPADATTTLPVHIYEITFQDFNLGLGSAAAMTLFAILAVFAIIFFWVFEPSKEVGSR